MKGVISGINPQARIIDITHKIQPFNITEGMLLLAASCNFFPPGTIFLCVIDPGVGGVRKPIAIETRNYFWVGPDNGLAGGLLQHEPAIQSVHLIRKEYFLTPVSQTFNGRDIFAPVAAQLSLGIPITSLGAPVKRLKSLKLPEPEIFSNRLEAEIIHIDNFGNLITNIHSLPKDFTGLKYKRHKIKQLCPTYCCAKTEELSALKGSFGYVELFFREASAADRLGAKVGDKVEVHLAGGHT